MTDEPTRVLLVEDDPAHAELVRRAFEASSKLVQLQVAETLAEARGCLDAPHGPPHLVISDWRLPDGEGMELLTEDQLANAPVIIMTSQGNERVAVGALKAGALDYVVKSETTLLDMPHIAERVLREWEIRTERERMQQALRESEERFRLLAENSTDVISRHSLNGDILYVSPAVHTLLGYDPAEIIGQSVLVVVHPDDQEAVRQSWAMLLDGSQVTPLRLRIRHRDGQYLWLESSGRAIRNAETGELEEVHLSSRDVTERKRSEEQFYRVFDFSPVAMLIARLPEMTLMDLNEAFVKMTGYERAEVLSRTPDDFNLWAGEDDRARVLTLVETSGIVKEVDIKYRARNGEVGVALLSFEPIDLNGVSCVLGSLYDITARKRVEDALRASEEKFYRAFHSSPMAMIIRRVSDRRYLDVNDTFCQMTGYDRSEAIGSTTLDLNLWVHPADRERSQEQLRTQGYIRDLEISFRKKSGEIGTVWTAAEYLDVNGELCTLVTLLDITARKWAEEALRESEEKFNKAFRSSPVAMAISDNVTRHYLEVNDAFVRLTGYPREELVGHTARDLNLWVDLQERERVMQQMAQQGFVHGYEVRVQTRSGEIRAALLSLETVELKGAPCLLTTVHDITERRRAEDALRASEDRFRSLVLNSQDIITVHDRDGTVIYESPSVARVFGYAPGYFIGKNPFEFIPLEDVAEAKRTFGEVVARQNTGVPTEYRFRRADGTHVYLEALGSNLLDHPGVRGIVITSRDVTERKRAESALRQYAERLSILHEIDQAVLSAKSIDEITEAALSRIQRSVPSWRVKVLLFDFEAEQAVVAAYYSDGTKLVPGERLPLSALGPVVQLQPGQLYVINDLSELLDPSLSQLRQIGDGARSSIDAPLIVLGQQIGLLSVDATQWDAFQGEVVDVVCEVADQLAVAIQNARLLEQIQRHAHELEQRVAERTRELAKANERLTELDRLKSKFVSDVSHELRTPIANLKLHVELLEHGRVDKRDHYLSVVKQQSRRLGELVDDILNLSRLEMGRERAALGPVDLNFVVEQIVAAHQPRAESSGLALSFEPLPNLPPVCGEVNQLAQVVTNLVINALNYTSEGFVRVSTFQGEVEACLRIEDSGIGIDPDDLPNIFDRFYRGRGSQRSETPGTGLGLAIVKEIVDLHDGRIEVNSQVKQGTTFKVWLPLFRENGAS